MAVPQVLGELVAGVNKKSAISLTSGAGTIRMVFGMPPAGNMLPAPGILCRRPQYRAGIRNMVLAPVAIFTRLQAEHST